MGFSVKIGIKGTRPCLGISGEGLFIYYRDRRSHGLSGIVTFFCSYRISTCLGISVEGARRPVLWLWICPAEVREELNKNSAKGYVAPGKEPVSVTYDCNSYS